MGMYRLYFIDRRNGHIDDVVTIDAQSSDREAIELASKNLGRRMGELWQGARCVCRMDACQLDEA